MIDWSRVKFTAAHKPQPMDCSYCGAAVDDEESVPIRCWNDAGDGAVFCEGCAPLVLQQVMAEDRE